MPFIIPSSNPGSNLLAIKTEALNHGFDPTVFGARMTQYINDAQALMCSRVDYYVNESTQDFTTVPGTATYGQPADLGRDRSLRYVGASPVGELTSCTLREIDRSATASGAPRYYAIDGGNLHLYPTPDQAYALELRYWLLPPDLVNDTDVPTIPARYHRALWEYAVAQAYWAEDDQAMGQAWEQKFAVTLSTFASDVKFPSDDAPVQVADYWQGPSRVGAASWSRFGS